MLVVQEIRKRYGAQVAVDGVSLRVEPGQMVGLLGPNGAGKTTTVAIIAGLLEPDAGEVTIGGRRLSGDADPLKRRLGLVPQELALYDEIPARDNLRLFASLYGLDGAARDSAIGAALDLVGLAERARDRVATFSGGMKRRLNLAAALLHDPDILLLDEPTVGVDPQSRAAIFENLEALRRRGKALLYTTHYMEEAERLCDRIVIIDHGEVIADDTVRGLYGRLPARNQLTVELDSDGDGDTWPDELRALQGVTSVELQDGVLEIGLADLPTSAPSVLAWLAGHGHPYHHVVSERADLETVFLTLTGRSLRDS